MRTIFCACVAVLSAMSLPARAETPPTPAGYQLDAGFLQLMGEGSSGAVAGVKHDQTALGVTEFDYADGSRLIIKTTQYSPGSASVVGLIGNGRLGLPKSLAGQSWATAFLPLGGTPWASYEQIEHWLNASGHAVQLNFLPQTRAFHFDGASSTRDLGYQIALLCGIARHPTVSGIMLHKAAEFGSTLNVQMLLARSIWPWLVMLMSLRPRLPSGNGVCRAALSARPESRCRSMPPLRGASTLGLSCASTKKAPLV